MPIAPVVGAPDVALEPPETPLDGQALACAAAVIVLALALHLPGVYRSFLEYEDYAGVVSNPRLNPPTLANAAQAWVYSQRGGYAPATVFFQFVVANALGGVRQDLTGAAFHSVPFHVASMMTHAAVAVAVLALLRRLTEDNIAALAGAVFFAWHPLQVEAVAWVSQQGTLLAGFCGVLALLNYLRYVAARQAEAEADAQPAGRYGPQGWRLWWRQSQAIAYYVLATFWLLVGVLCGLSASAVPLLAAVLDRYWLRRSWSAVMRSLALWLVIMAVVWASAHGVASEPLPSGHAALWQRPLLAGHAITVHAWHVLWPFGLTIDYGLSPRTVTQGWLWLVAWMLPVAAAVSAWRSAHRRVWLTGLGLFLAALVPWLGLCPLEFQQHSTVADRYAYLAMLGPALLLAQLVVAWQQPRRRAAVAAALFVLGIFALGQSGSWKDDTQLFGRALELNPRSCLAHEALGAFELRRGDAAAARAQFESAVAVEPDAADAIIQLARLQTAAGEGAAALQGLERAMALRPEHDEARRAMADALLAQGRLAEAAGQYQILVDRNPLAVGPQFLLGVTHRLSGRPTDAVKRFRAVLRQEPEHVRAKGELAWLLATHPDAEQRNGEEAVVLAEQYCQAKSYDDPPGLDALAASYAELGRWEDAVERAQQARDSAVNAGDTQLASEIIDRLEGYRQKRPHRLTPSASTGPDTQDR